MEPEYLQITLPNICGLIVNGTTVTYVEGSPTAKIFTPPGYSAFEEFEEKTDAALRAIEIDPNYSTDGILGFLVLDPTNLSPGAQEISVGANITLNSEYECTDPTATITYSWSGPTGNLGVTASSLTFDNVTDAYAGIYTCVVTASNPLNQSGTVSNSFTFTVIPAPEPSGVLNTGRSGASPQDLAPSYFPSLSNLPAGVTEAQLELYIPGTDTVIPYNDKLPLPFRFDSSGDCFNPGDYRTVIRIAATSEVLATVYPVAGPNKDIFWLYNPVVPS